jgi:hypothetical protein
MKSKSTQRHAATVTHKQTYISSTHALTYCKLNAPDIFVWTVFHKLGINAQPATKFRELSGK